MKTEHFHRTPEETYARLVTLFGEDDNAATIREGETLTRWVRVGAGDVTLVFFPERELVEPEFDPSAHEPAVAAR